MISLTLKRNEQNQSEKIVMKNQPLHMFMCVCVCVCVCVYLLVLNPFIFHSMGGRAQNLCSEFEMDKFDFAG